VFEAQGQLWWWVTGWHHQKIDRPTYKFPQPHFDEPSTSPRRALATDVDDGNPASAPLHAGSAGDGQEAEGNGKLPVIAGWDGYDDTKARRILAKTATEIKAPINGGDRRLLLTVCALIERKAMNAKCVAWAAKQAATEALDNQWPRFHAILTEAAKLDGFDLDGTIAASPFAGLKDKLAHRSASA
jgi:hypothetical protein